MNIFRTFVRFLVLVLLQVLLFDHLNFFGLCHPYIYILGLICMPLMPRWVDMFVAFLIGFVMDMVCSSMGIHTAACVLIAYLRPMLLSQMIQDPDRVVQDVCVSSIGLSQYIRLSIVLCMVHHAVVFMMDAGGFAHFGFTFLRWTISSVITLTIVLGYGIMRKS